MPHRLFMSASNSSSTTPRGIFYRKVAKAVSHKKQSLVKRSLIE